MALFNFHVRQKKLTSSVDRAMSVAAILHPMMALPQVYAIYSTHSAGQVLLITWLLFSLIGVVFLGYALVDNIKPLIVTQLLWFIMDAIIVAGILLYS